MQRRRFVQGSALGLALPWALPARAAGSGHAVLVGNSSYNPLEEEIAPAQKCITDLQALLERLGYTVTVLYNPPLDRVRTELDALRQAVAAAPDTAGLFYFVGHGFQSNAENLLVPAGGNLAGNPAQLARTCVSLERDVFSRLKRPPGQAATVILIDACRTPDRPLSPNEGYNQTLPPEGCHVAFATGPGKRAFAPQDPKRYTLFTEMLVGELATTEASRSIYTTLERVRSKVLKRVNGIEVIVRAFGANAQMPELASNVAGDPAWLVAPPAVAAPAAPEAPASAPEAAVHAQIDAASTAATPEAAAAGLKALLGKLPEGEAADLAQLRLADLEIVLRAARQSRLNLDISALLASAAPRVAEDARRALRGDKYAAMRVAESLRPPGENELIERTDHGRWMAFAAYLGNGIAAYRLSEHFKNVDRRDTEASRYLNLARANQYTPPRQLTSDR